MNLAASINNITKFADSSNVLTFNEASSSINNHNEDEDEAASFQIINTIDDTNYNDSLKHLEQEEDYDSSIISNYIRKNEMINIENKTNLNLKFMSTKKENKDYLIVNKSTELIINKKDDEESNKSIDEIIPASSDDQNDKTSLLQHQSLLDSKLTRSSQFSIKNNNNNDNKKKSRKSKSTTSLIRRLFLCGGSCVSSRNPSSLHNEFNKDNPNKNSTHSLVQQALIVETTANNKKLIKQQEIDESIQNNDIFQKEKDNSLKNIKYEITDKENSNDRLNKNEHENHNNHNKIDKNETDISIPKLFVLPLLKLNDDLLTPNTNNEYYELSSAFFTALGPEIVYLYENRLFTNK